MPAVTRVFSDIIMHSCECLLYRSLTHLSCVEWHAHVSELAVAACSVLGLLPSVQFQARLHKVVLSSNDNQFESTLPLEAHLKIFAQMVFLISPNGKVGVKHVCFYTACTE